MASKMELNNYCQRTKIPIDKYQTEETKEGRFYSTLRCGDRVFQSEGTFKSKKEAENSVASVALKEMVKCQPTTRSAEANPSVTDCGVKQIQTTVPPPWNMLTSSGSHPPAVPYSAVSSKPTYSKLETEVEKKYALLEMMCKAKGLGPPNLTISYDQAGHHAIIRIQNYEFKSQSVYSTFNEAKMEIIERALSELGRNVTVYPPMNMLQPPPPGYMSQPHSSSVPMQMSCHYPQQFYYPNSHDVHPPFQSTVPRDGADRMTHMITPPQMIPLRSERPHHYPFTSTSPIKYSSPPSVFFNGPQRPPFHPQVAEPVSPQKISMEPSFTRHEPQIGNQFISNFEKSSLNDQNGFHHQELPLLVRPAHPATVPLPPQGPINSQRLQPPSAFAHQHVTPNFKVAVDAGRNIQPHLITPSSLQDQFARPPIDPSKKLWEPTSTVAKETKKPQNISKQNINAKEHKGNQPATSTDKGTDVKDQPQAKSIPELGYKQTLNEYVQKKKWSTPNYSTEPAKDCVGYIGIVSVNGKNYQSPPDKSKKNAQALAALEALKDFGVVMSDASHKSGGEKVKKSQDKPSGKSYDTELTYHSNNPLI